MTPDHQPSPAFRVVVNRPSGLRDVSSFSTYSAAARAFHNETSIATWPDLPAEHALAEVRLEARKRRRWLRLVSLRIHRPLPRP